MSKFEHFTTTELRWMRRALVTLVADGSFSRETRTLLNRLLTQIESEDGHRHDMAIETWQLEAR